MLERDSNGGAEEMPIEAPGAADSFPLTVQRRLVAWDPVTGAPIVKDVPMIPKVMVADVALAALSMPYDDPIGLEPQFRGLTNLEVMMIKRANRAAKTGDGDESDKLLDRVLGKTKIMSEIKKVNIDYVDFLKAVAAGLPTPAIPSIPTTAEPDLGGGIGLP